MQGKIDAVDGQVKIEFGVSVGATVVVDEVVEKATVLVDGIGVVVVEVVVDEGVVDSAGANVIESVELLRAKVLGVNALMVVKKERRPSVADH